MSTHTVTRVHRKALSYAARVSLWRQPYWGSPRVVRHYAAAYERVSVRAWVVLVALATAAGMVVGALNGAWQNGGLAGLVMSAVAALTYRTRGRQAHHHLDRTT